MNGNPDERKPVEVSMEQRPDGCSEPIVPDDWDDLCADPRFMDWMARLAEDAFRDYREVKAKHFRVKCDRAIAVLRSYASNTEDAEIVLRSLESYDHPRMEYSLIADGDEITLVVDFNGKALSHAIGGGTDAYWDHKDFESLEEGMRWLVGSA